MTEREEIQGGNPTTDPFNPLITRRALLGRMAVAAGAAAGVTALGWPVVARAVAPVPPGTADKSALQYQDHPNGTSACANCANFIPGKSADAAGRCIIVAGDISPKGWCLAYADNA
jgi:hypothetical protein